MAASHVFATRTFVTGTGHTVVHGAHYLSDDPVVKAYPESFTDDPRYGLSSSVPLGEDGYPAPAPEERPAKAPVVEEATAAPGEKRSRGRAKK